MNIIDILGFIATAAVLSSFLFKDMVKLRVINAVGATLWLIYGILKSDVPLIIVNLSIITIHITFFISNKIKWKS